MMLLEIFKLIMQVILLYLAEPWLMIPRLARAVVVYAVQKVYLRTSQQLRSLGREAKARVHSDFLETVGNRPCCFG